MPEEEENKEKVVKSKGVEKAPVYSNESDSDSGSDGGIVIKFKERPGKGNFALSLIQVSERFGSAQIVHSFSAHVRASPVRFYFHINI